MRSDGILPPLRSTLGLRRASCSKSRLDVVCEGVGGVNRDRIRYIRQRTAQIIRLVVDIGWSIHGCVIQATRLVGAGGGVRRDTGQVDKLVDGERRARRRVRMGVGLYCVDDRLAADEPVRVHGEVDEIFKVEPPAKEENIIGMAESGADQSRVDGPLFFGLGPPALHIGVCKVGERGVAC